MAPSDEIQTTKLNITLESAPGSDGKDGQGMLVYDAEWPPRGPAPSLRLWVSTTDPAAPPPPMTVGDMWIRHPDAAEAP